MSHKLIFPHNYKENLTNSLLFKPLDQINQFHPLTLLKSHTNTNSKNSALLHFHKLQSILELRGKSIPHGVQKSSLRYVSRSPFIFFFGVA
jgi:hypothetical protein